MGVDHAVAVAQATLRGPQLGGVAAVEGVDQARVAGRCRSVGLQQGERLAQGGRLAVAPGLAKLVDAALLGGIDDAEPQENASRSQASQCGEGAGEEVVWSLAGGLGFGRRAVPSVAGGVLAAALEEFH
ncbi:hypothetical protein D9M70_614680 [compost metagenome]